MAQDPPTTPAVPQAPTTPTTTADVANAAALNQAVGQVQQTLSSNSAAAITAINAVTTAVTQSLVGGVVGTSTQRILRANTVSGGASAGSLQGSTVTLDNNGSLTGVDFITFVTGGGVFTGTSATNTARLAAYNTNTASYTIFGTLTANNPPTFDLNTATTLGGVNIATLNTNTWNQQQGFAEATLTDAATIAWNLQTQQTAYVLIANNRTMGTPTNIVAGFTYILFVQQDASGNRTLSFPKPPFYWPNGVAPVLSTGAFQVDVFTFAALNTSYLCGVLQKNLS